MRLEIAGVKDHQAHEDYHVAQAVQRRVEKPAKTRNPAGKTGHLPIQHVEQVGHNQGDAGPEKRAQTKEKTATDVQSHADNGQNIGTVSYTHLTLPTSDL